MNTPPRSPSPVFGLVDSWQPPTQQQQQQQLSFGESYESLQHVEPDQPIIITDNTTVDDRKWASLVSFRPESCECASSSERNCLADLTIDHVCNVSHDSVLGVRTWTPVSLRCDSDRLGDALAMATAKLYQIIDHDAAAGNSRLSQIYAELGSFLHVCPHLVQQCSRDDSTYLVGQLEYLLLQVVSLDPTTRPPQPLAKHSPSWTRHHACLTVVAGCLTACGLRSQLPAHAGNADLCWRLCLLAADWLLRVQLQPGHVVCTCEHVVWSVLSWTLAKCDAFRDGAQCVLAVLCGQLAQHCPATDALYYQLRPFRLTADNCAPLLALMARLRSALTGRGSNAVDFSPLVKTVFKCAAQAQAKQQTSCVLESIPLLATAEDGLAITDICSTLIGWFFDALTRIDPEQRIDVFYEKSSLLDDAQMSVGDWDGWIQQLTDPAAAAALDAQRTTLCQTVLLWVARACAGNSAMQTGFAKVWAKTVTPKRWKEILSSRRSLKCSLTVMLIVAETFEATSGRSVVDGQWQSLRCGPVSHQHLDRERVLLNAYCLMLARCQGQQPQSIRTRNHLLQTVVTRCAELEQLCITRVADETALQLLSLLTDLHNGALTFLLGRSSASVADWLPLLQCPALGPAFWLPYYFKCYPADLPGVWRALAGHIETVCASCRTQITTATGTVSDSLLKLCTVQLPEKLQLMFHELLKASVTQKEKLFATQETADATSSAVYSLLLLLSDVSQQQQHNSWSSSVGAVETILTSILASPAGLPFGVYAALFWAMLKLIANNPAAANVHIVFQQLLSNPQSSLGRLCCRMWFRCAFEHSSSPGSEQLLLDVYSRLLPVCAGPDAWVVVAVTTEVDAAKKPLQALLRLIGESLSTNADSAKPIAFLRTILPDIEAGLQCAKTPLATKAQFCSLADAYMQLGVLLTRCGRLLYRMPHNNNQRYSELAHLVNQHLLHKQARDGRHDDKQTKAACFCVAAALRALVTIEQPDRTLHRYVRELLACYSAVCIAQTTGKDDDFSWVASHPISQVLCSGNAAAAGLRTQIWLPLVSSELLKRTASERSVRVYVEQLVVVGYAFKQQQQQQDTTLLLQEILRCLLLCAAIYDRMGQRCVRYIDERLLDTATDDTVIATLVPACQYAMVDVKSSVGAMDAQMRAHCRRLLQRLADRWPAAAQALLAIPL